jgi:hypothetical protein
MNTKLIHPIFSKTLKIFKRNLQIDQYFSLILSGFFDLTKVFPL